MRFTPTSIVGVYEIEAERASDERGYFARLWDADLFQEMGLVARIVQTSMSYNARAGTVRGLHWQRVPHAEVKIVRCTRGAIFDVVVDLRADSPSFQKWYGVELTEDNALGLYVPAGVAHGFQTLRDSSDVLYQMSERHEPAAAAGCRFDDPSFNIVWPLKPTAISHRDNTWPPFGDPTA